MSLALYDSIIYGNLREAKLNELKTTKDIGLLNQEISKLCSQNNLQLHELEELLVNLIEKEHLALLSEDYEKDRELRKEAEKQHKACYTAYNEYHIFRVDALFERSRYTTCPDRLYGLLGIVDNLRTMLHLIKLAIVAKNDEILLGEVRNVMLRVLKLAESTEIKRIKESLMMLYFNLLRTFWHLLQHNTKGLFYEFSETYRTFTNEYPPEELERAYNKLIQSTPDAQRSAGQTAQPAQPEPASATGGNEWVTRFLAEARKYHFLDLEKVKALDSEQKVKKLVACILGMDTPHEQPAAHAAAMLAYLGFENSFGQYYDGRFTRAKYDKWCERHIMRYPPQRAKGCAFKHYRLSVHLNAREASGGNYKYKGWYYYGGIVQKEYQKILNE